MTADFTADILVCPVPQVIAQAKALLTQGIELAKLQEFERAIAHFTQSIRLTLTLLQPIHTTDLLNAGEISSDAIHPLSIGEIQSLDVADRSLSTVEMTTVEVTAKQSFYHRGCAFSRLEKYGRAITDFTHLIQQPPTSSAIPATWLISKLTEIYIHRGNAHRRLGEYDQALSDLNQAITRSNGSAQSYSGRGLLHLDMGNYTQAIDDLSAAIEQHPTFAQAYLWRGFAHLRSQNPQQAITDLDHAIAAIPTCAEAYNHRGIAHLHCHNLAQAEADFSQAIRLDPNFAEAYNNRGNLHQLLGNSTRASVDYEQAIAIDPTLAELFFNRAVTLTQDTAQALLDYEITAGLSPNNAAFYRHRAQVKAQTGRITAAIADYTTALSITPTAQALYQRGRLYLQLGENENALKDFDSAITRSPDYRAAYCDRSHLYFQSHDLSKALEDANKAIELSPGNYDLKETFITRCLTHFSLGNKQQALEDFEQTVQLIIQNQHQLANTYGN